MGVQLGSNDWIWLPTLLFHCLDTVGLSKPGIHLVYQHTENNLHLRALPTLTRINVSAVYSETVITDGKILH
jgi:hypothetical protein